MPVGLRGDHRRAAALAGWYKTPAPPMAGSRPLRSLQRRAAVPDSGHKLMCDRMASLGGFLPVRLRARMRRDQIFGSRPGLAEGGRLLSARNAVKLTMLEATDAAAVDPCRP